MFVYYIGKFKVPEEGFYLLQTMVNAEHFRATHDIEVNGTRIATIHEEDMDEQYQEASSVVVIRLQKGQEVLVRPNFAGKITGSANEMDTCFGATLLFTGN